MLPGEMRRRAPALAKAVELEGDALSSPRFNVVTDPGCNARSTCEDDVPPPNKAIEIMPPVYCAML